MIARRLHKFSEAHAFATAIMRSPRQVGAVVPSGRFLCGAMARQVDPHHPGYVVELGGGTGAVTRALLAQGVKPERLIVIERDRRLYKHLQKIFPHLRVVKADAVHLAEVLEEERVHKISAIVSSLPMLSLPKETQEAIMQQIALALEEGGALVQFTYGPTGPVPGRLLKRHHLKAERAARVLLNLPPATVWRYVRDGY